MQTSNRFTGNLANYQDILSIGYHIFQSSNIRITGTREYPLFNCLDVVKILGCKQTNDNWFYRKNSDNPEFIVAQSITLGSQSLNSECIHDTTHQTTINQHSAMQHYFTETGLYECLFTSDSKIAKKFRKEMIQILKNLRLGVINLQIQCMNTLEQQLTQTKNERDSCLDLLQKKDATIAEYSDKLAKIERNLSTYEVRDKTTGKSYIGSSFDVKVRANQHMRCSSNKELRSTFNMGHDIEINVLKTFKVCNDDDRKFVERQAIDSFPKSKLMNIQLPRPNLSRVTLQEEEKLSIVNESVRICSNCRRTMIDSDTVSCQQCLTSIKNSKVKRSQQPLADDKMFCNKCSCVRDKSAFVKNSDGILYKTCKNCRDRNIKTTQDLILHNQTKPDQKLCTLCHKPNQNQTSQCQTCLDKKKANRKYCQHERLHDQCGEGDCIENARNMCKIHRVRNPCAQCINILQ